VNRAVSSAAPLVSIVTPTLNQASFIEATLVSVMGQTYPWVQHIVVDGGSTDGTQEILARYQGRYNLTWTSGADNGMYEAVNRGMSSADGDVLAYLNSDDLYLPWTIETVVHRLQRDHSAEVVFGDALLLNDSSRRVRLAFFPPFTRAFVLRSGFLVQPTVFWRRTAYEAVGGFDEHLRFVGDLDYWIRLSERCRFAKIDEILAVEQRHAAAKTSAFSAEVLLEASHVRSRHDRAGRIIAWLSGIGERARSWLWRRAYWLKFLLARRGVLRTGDRWAGFLGAATPELSLARVGLLQVPFLGWRFADDAVVPSPAWIDQLTGRNEPS
jgi:glycosyltransferase involved in cell wall biosynthesis